MIGLGERDGASQGGRKKRLTKTAPKRPESNGPGIDTTCPCIGLESPEGCVRNRIDRATTANSPCYSRPSRSEEHTSELQSLMRISYAVFCLKIIHMITIPIPSPHSRLQYKRLFAVNILSFNIPST